MYLNILVTFFILYYDYVAINCVEKKYNLWLYGFLSKKIESLCVSARITQSFIAEAYGESNKPVCDFLAGFFVGVLEEMTGKQLTGEEIACTSRCDPTCTFKFEPVNE